MGVDAKMLQRLEKWVQEGFIDGVPPHLLSSARSLTYAAKSDQSHFFVALHSEYINLTPQTILGVLHKRHIIVHSHPFDHQYGWNLDSFAHLYDIDKITTVHSEANFISIVILANCHFGSCSLHTLFKARCAAFPSWSLWDHNYIPCWEVSSTKHHLPASSIQELAGPIQMGMHCITWAGAESHSSLICNSFQCPPNQGANRVVVDR